MHVAPPILGAVCKVFGPLLKERSKIVIAQLKDNKNGLGFTKYAAEAGAEQKV